MKFRNLMLIGTSHISKQSLKEVREAVESFKPEIIAIELDKRRVIALTQKNKNARGPRLRDIRRIGLKGFIFSLIGAWVEKKLGKMVGVAPGSEMLTAIKLAKKNNIPLALIDQDIEITLKRFSQELTWKEKWHFVEDIFKAVVLRKKEELGFDLAEVPSNDIIKKLIDKVRFRYPSIYKVLIEERNIVMAKNLNTLIEKNPEKSILGIIGAGHEEEIISLIKNMSSNVAITLSFDAEY